MELFIRYESVEFIYGKRIIEGESDTVTAGGFMNNYLTKELLIQKYAEEGLSCNQVAETEKETRGGSAGYL